MARSTNKKKVQFMSPNIKICTTNIDKGTVGTVGRYGTYVGSHSSSAGKLFETTKRESGESYVGTVPSSQSNETSLLFLLKIMPYSALRK